MADWKSALSVLAGMGSGNDAEDFETTTDATSDGSKCAGRGATTNATKGAASDTTMTSAQKRAQKLRLAMERAGRGGKTVTIVRGFTGSQEELEELCKTLKQKIGVGGSAKEGEIILQGDHRPKLAELLKSLGYSNTK